MSINLMTGEVDKDALTKVSSDMLNGMATALGIDPTVFKDPAELIECINAVTQVHAGKTSIQAMQDKLDRPDPVQLPDISCGGEYIVDTGQTDPEGRPIHRCRLRQNIEWVGDNGCVGCENIHGVLTHEQTEAIAVPADPTPAKQPSPVVIQKALK